MQKAGFLVVVILVLALSLSLSVFTSTIARASTPSAMGPFQPQTGQGIRGSSIQLPVAIFTYTPEIPQPGDTIVFDASASHAPSGSIVQYTWDFGDGNVTTVTDPTITHSYPLDGNYTVELTVTDNYGQTATAAAVIQVQKEIYFRISFYGTVIPAANAQVTIYYYNGTAWAEAPARSSNPGVQIIYDSMTQPNKASTPSQKNRNPGFTASILFNNASNIGFDTHPSSMLVFFKIEWGPYVAYWPNNTNTYLKYDKYHGTAVQTNFEPCDRPYWDGNAGTYVIEAAHIKSGESSPIVTGVFCPPPPTNYYLTVRTDPTSITTIPGQGNYAQNTNVTLTAPTYVNVSSTSRYRFNYWDVDGTSRGSGVNPITVFMNANHTATAHYIMQYYLTVSSPYDSPSPASAWFDSGSSITESVTTPVSGGSGTQYICTGWTGTGSVPASGTTSSVTFAISAPSSITWAWKTQYYLTVSSARDSPSPSSGWFDSGSSITESVTSPVSGGSGIQYVCTGWTGTGSVPTSGTGISVGFTITAPSSITWNWKTQYYLAVVSARDSPSPVSGWFDSGSSITESVTSPVSGGSGIQYVCTGWTGTGSVPTSGTGISVGFTITAPSSITWNWKTQYQVTFDQTGVDQSFTGTVVSIDSVNYGVSSLSVSFWWDSGGSHSFSFASPLVVGSVQYVWSSTSGLSTLQSGTLAAAGSGSVVGNYQVQNQVTFDQVGVNPDFTSTVVIIDSVSYSRAQLPVSFSWGVGSVHSFAFQSPLVVGSNTEQYVWTSTTGLSSSQSTSITITAYGSIIGNYKTQYYLTVSSAYDSPSPSSGWFDSGSSVTESVTSPVSGGSGTQYVCTGWSGSGSVPASGTASSVTFAITQASSIAWNWKTQYKVTFDQSGVGSDFTGTLVTIDSINYGVGGLPISFWWDSSSSHTFSFSSPLLVNVSEQYNWVSTSGLTTLQSGSLSVAVSGSVTGNYAIETKLQVTFRQTGLIPDFTGTVLTVDATNYKVLDLPVSFWWDPSSVHSFAYQSPLIVSPSAKQYVWTGTTGLSTLQSDSITVTTSGTITGNYKTQYYLTLVTDPSGVNSPSGAGWYDAGTNATVSTDAFVDIIPGSSRYRFNGWTTGDMSEISNPLASPTTVLVDKAKTTTANYVVQYKVAFNQAGVGLDFTGTVVMIDGVNYTVTTLPASFWWDNNTAHAFAFQSPLVAIPNAKGYGWANTTGLSTLQTGTLTILGPGGMTGNYRTQYYLTVTSPCDSPTPASGWFDAGASITASVTSPASGPAGTQYLCTGWSGTGSVPSSGSGTTTAFTITQASTITWNWKIQYYLTVKTDPLALVAIPGQGWYDASSSVPLNAPPVAGWNFSYWDVDGASQGSTNPITVNMNAARTATAHYIHIAGQPLTVSISPMAATTSVGIGVPFTSTVGGGTAPYTYQWYLDGNPVSGATSTSWTFTPPGVGIYYMYLRVTDANGTTAQSGTSPITVIQPPTGGYSISLAKQTPTSYLVAYGALIALFGATLSLKKRKRK